MSTVDGERLTGKRRDWTAFDALVRLMERASALVLVAALFAGCMDAGIAPVWPPTRETLVGLRVTGPIDAACELKTPEYRKYVLFPGSALMPTDSSDAIHWDVRSGEFIGPAPGGVRRVWLGDRTEESIPFTLTIDRDGSSCTWSGVVDVLGESQS